MSTNQGESADSSGQSESTSQDNQNTQKPTTQQPNRPAPQTPPPAPGDTMTANFAEYKADTAEFTEGRGE